MASLGAIAGAGFICAGIGALLVQADDPGPAYAMAWKESLALFFYGDDAAAIQKDIAARTEKIARLQDAVAACKSCPDEAALKKELAQARGLRGDEKAGHDKTTEHYRKHGVAEDCLVLLANYQGCKTVRGGDPSEYGPCGDEYQLFSACEKGDAGYFAKVMARKAARDAGKIIPRTEMRAAIFGEVPDSYNPPVPPPSYLQREPELALMMNKRAKGALTQVRLKTLDEWVYHYLLAGRLPFIRKNLTDKTIAEIEAVGRAAQGIKDAYVLECSYQQDKMLLKTSAFWWEKRPDVPMDRLAVIESGAQAYTRSGGIEGKIIPIGGARTQCPDQW